MACLPVWRFTTTGQLRAPWRLLHAGVSLIVRACRTALAAPENLVTHAFFPGFYTAQVSSFDFFTSRVHVHMRSAGSRCLLGLVLGHTLAACALAAACGPRGARTPASMVTPTQEKKSAVVPRRTLGVVESTPNAKAAAKVEE